MGKYGVNALDVGTGPGPSAFAIHDFYKAMVDFSSIQSNPKWSQPANVTCVEFDSSTNHFRHILAEVMFEHGQRASEGVLAMCFNLKDFGALEPTRERKEYLRSLPMAQYDYFDDVRGEWHSEQEYLPDEVHVMAGALHRYRLITFSNFLTSVKTVRRFETNLIDVLHDAAPGSVLLVLGGKQEPYPEVYSYVDRLAGPAGFEQKISGATVSCSERTVADRVHKEQRAFYQHLQGLSKNGDDATRELRAEFERPESPNFPSSEIRAYRKHRYTKRRNPVEEVEGV